MNFNQLPSNKHPQNQILVLEKANNNIRKRVENFLNGVYINAEITSTGCLKCAYQQLKSKTFILMIWDIDCSLTPYLPIDVKTVLRLFPDLSILLVSENRSSLYPNFLLAGALDCIRMGELEERLPAVLCRRNNCVLAF